MSLVNPHSTRRARLDELAKGLGSKNHHQSAISQQRGSDLTLRPQSVGGLPEDDYKQVSKEKRSLLKGGSTPPVGAARTLAKDYEHGTFLHKVFHLHHKAQASYLGTPSQTALHSAGGTPVHSPDVPIRRLQPAASSAVPVTSAAPTPMVMGRTLQYHADVTTTPKRQERKEPIVPDNVAAQFVYLRFCVSDTGTRQDQ